MMFQVTDSVETQASQNSHILGIKNQQLFKGFPLPFLCVCVYYVYEV